jgi:hypothetical protein
MADHNQSLRRRGAGLFAAASVILLMAIGCIFVWSGKILGGKPLCAACQRELHAGNVFVTIDERGAKHETCCPRCGLRHVLIHGGRALEATDYATGKLIAAEEAIYLEGSDVMQCCTVSGFRESGGGFSSVEYDRCLPSLLAFSKREEAEVVRQKHGGRIISFGEARESVARQLDR